MSGKMAAIVGYILDEEWTNPSLQEMAITSDGFVMAGVKGDCRMNEFIGSVSDLERNVNNLLNVAELTEAERKEWDRLYRARITDWRLQSARI